MADESFVFYFPSYTVTPTFPDVAEDSIIGGFGTGPFGSMPFGSAFAAEPSVLSIVFVEAVAVDTVRIHLNTEAVVNGAYKNIANYKLTDSNGNIAIIRSVMWPKASESYPYVQLYVRNLIETQTYTVSITGLLSRKGFGIDNVPGSFTYVRTKVDSIVSSMPVIFDTTAEANLRALLTAISLEDNIISGAPDGLEENV